MFFSLVIVNYRTYNLTRNCLQSFFDHCPTANFEIILVDNASGDQSIEKIAAEFGEKIKIIKNQTNLGFGPANNQGAKIARGDWLFFVNSDTIIENDILSSLEKFIAQHPRSAIIAPRLLDSQKIPQAAAFGKMPTLSQIIKKNVQPKLKLKPEEIDWVSGAALLIKKTVFDEVKGWDEKFFMYLEDTDLCWRVKKLGYAVSLCPEATIIHFGGQSFSDNKIKRKYYFLSQNYFFRKHYGRLTELLMRVIRLPYKLWVLR
ncbi:MAG TPA: glycosyltransferase family 2 protein [bacterium]|nr:glycosyltransferase family 2 protein [bacterium]HPT29663.1 glycosyltransferase family 2 protein [bacterium]